jgi:cysteine dioxygenase
MNLVTAIEELKAGAKDMRLPDLRKLVSSLRPEEKEIEPYIQFTENHYARNLIYKTSHFEVLVLCWRPGQRSPIHDHGDSICSVYTHNGVLSADNYRRMANGHIRADFSEDFPEGSVLSIQTTEIHQVSNLQDTRDLVSLHFYLSPLEDSRIFNVNQPTFEAYRRGYTRVFTRADGI